MAMQTTTERLLSPLQRIFTPHKAATDGQLLAEFEDSCSQTAFAELVHRHGPMVLGVCQRVIGDKHLAEDAFQAVFLVLARRVAAVRPREALGAWLYATAYRTALKARSSRLRSLSRETPMDPLPAISAPVVTEDSSGILDEEIAALPEHLRVAFVLCDIEGRPQRDVAAQLGIALSSLAGRLGTARKRLAARLTKRGVTLGTASLTATVTASSVNNLAHAAATLAAGGTLVGLVPTTALQLSEGVLQMMILTKLKATATVFVISAMLFTGFGATSLPMLLAEEPAKPKPAIGPNLTDAEYLRRVCVDLRGTPPTTVEYGYFLPDTDANKRKKVLEWATTPVTQAAVVKDQLFLFGSMLNARHFDLTAQHAKCDRIELPAYTLGTPDVVTFKLTGKSVPSTWQKANECLIRPDGTINLNEYGSLKIDGLTIPQAQENLQKHLKAKIADDIAVNLDVLAYNSKSYSLLFTGDDDCILSIRLALSGNETILDSVNSIRGLTIEPNSNIWIERVDTKGKQVLPVDWQGITKQGQTNTNYQILNGDKVYVKGAKTDNVRITSPGTLTQQPRIQNCTHCHQQTPQNLGISLFVPQLGTERLQLDAVLPTTNGLYLNNNVRWLSNDLQHTAHSLYFRLGDGVESSDQFLASSWPAFVAKPAARGQPGLRRNTTRPTRTPRRARSF